MEFQGFRYRTHIDTTHLREVPIQNDVFFFFGGRTCWNDSDGDLNDEIQLGLNHEQRVKAIFSCGLGLSKRGHVSMEYK